MSLQNTFYKTAMTIIILAFSLSAHGQSKQYQRKKPAEAPAAAAAPGAPAAGAAKAGDKAPPADAKKDSEKLDISDLEQKYWAPKDTDFSVVQNRTYTKAKKFGVSLLTGPIINDAFNEGYNYHVGVNYYLDERYGFEAMFISADLKDSDVTHTFKKTLGGGNTSPDFNRSKDYYGLGFNWVPFYAKMSFLGQKIIYFDMQITPHIGMSSYEQQNEDGNGAIKTGAFSYGLDVTQYFFVHQKWAIRANVHNRWYKEDIVYYRTNQTRRSDTANITNFLIGVTYFF